MKQHENMEPAVKTSHLLAKYTKVWQFHLKHKTFIRTTKPIDNHGNINNVYVTNEAFRSTMAHVPIKILDVLRSDYKNAGEK